MDKSYVSEFESRVKTGIAAARQALKNAIEAQDVEAQVAAQEQIARLNADAARVNSLKMQTKNKDSKPKKRS